MQCRRVTNVDDKAGGVRTAAAVKSGNCCGISTMKKICIADDYHDAIPSHHGNSHSHRKAYTDTDTCTDKSLDRGTLSLSTLDAEIYDNPYYVGVEMLYQWVVMRECDMDISDVMYGMVYHECRWIEQIIEHNCHGRRNCKYEYDMSVDHDILTEYEVSLCINGLWRESDREQIIDWIHKIIQAIPISIS